MVDRIILAHGGGGTLMRELIEEQIGPAIGGVPSDMADSSPIPGAEDFAMTTDSFVVKPLFFRGGDIGSLSIHGTVNDLAVYGAQPLAVSMAIIIEEGLELEVLERVMASAGDAARECGIQIITGDTKVVASGEADELFINTTGVGRIRKRLSPMGLKEGDSVILSGCIAEHGIAVMSAREGIEFETTVRSDSRSVWPLAKALIEAGIELHAMRDPTRGGLAACCVELADASRLSVVLEDHSIPIKPEVAAACEMLGLDPLNVANEGKLVAFVGEVDVFKALDTLRKTPGGENSSIVGKTVRRRGKAVYLRTRYGGERIVDMPYGEELPRIC